MQRFAELFTKLDETTKTTVKVAALADYFAKVEDYGSEGKNYERMARLSQYKGRMPKVFSSYEKAIEAFEKLNDAKALASAHQRLGAVYQDHIVLVSILNLDLIRQKLMLLSKCLLL